MRGDITFIKGTGSNRRVAAGQDYLSGLVLYTGTLPSGFTTTKNIIPFYSIVDAENAGIVNTYADETKASGSYTVSAVGANGDTATVKVTEADGAIVNFGTYTKVSGDTTVTKVGDAITLLINNGTNVHGYTASNNAGAVTITARPSLGVSLNAGTPISVTLSAGATLAGTIVQFSAGVGSPLAMYHYHISEFFRANPSGVLYVGIFPVPSTYTFTEITSVQNFADGLLRQIGVFKDAVYASADLTAIQAEVLANCDAKHKPVSVLYAANLKATADITAIADVSTLTAYKTSSIIGQDGGGLGYHLYLSLGKSITNLGIALGMLSKSAASEDFGQPIDKFNLSNGTENEIPAFANGQLVSYFTDTALDAIDLKRHIFGMKYTGYSGTYFNENHTSITVASDYAYINDNRVIDKAIRGIYSALIPTLKGKLYKNADGTLISSTIAYLQTLALQPLYQMERDTDLSVVSESDVYIDPTQNVNNGTLIINIVLNENGIARNITVPISFK